MADTDIRITFKSETRKAEVGTRKAFKEIEKQAKKSSKNINVDLGGIGSKLLSLAKGPIGAFAGAFAFKQIISGLSSVINSVIKTGDELSKLSDKTGVPVEDLSDLGFAAEQSGTDINTLGKGLKDLSNRIFDANSGNKTAIKLFENLGISITDTNGNLKPTKDLFLEVSDAISGIEEPAKQAALAQDLMGRAGFELLPLLKSSSKGIKELTDRSRELGITFDEGTAESAVKATDAINEAKRAFEGLLRNAITPLLNPVIKVASFFAELFGTLGGDEVSKAIRNLKDLGTEASKIVISQFNIGKIATDELDTRAEILRLRKELNEEIAIGRGAEFRLVETVQEGLKTLIKTSEEQGKIFDFRKAELILLEAQDKLAKRLQKAQDDGFTKESLRVQQLSKTLNILTGQLSNVISLEQAETLLVELGEKKLGAEQRLLDLRKGGIVEVLAREIEQVEALAAKRLELETKTSQELKEIKVKTLAESIEEFEELEEERHARSLERRQEILDAISVGLEATTGLLQGFANFEAQQRQQKINTQIKDVQQTAKTEKEKLKVLLDSGKISREEFTKQTDFLEKQEQVRTENLKNKLKERSGIEKISSISKALIDTFSSANAAFRAMAGIPIVGPALGAAAAAAAIALGLKNVASIRSTPGFEHGGILRQGETGFIEGTAREIIAPEKDFIGVVNDLISSRQIIGSDTGMDKTAFRELLLSNTQVSMEIVSLKQALLDNRWAIDFDKEEIFLVQEEGEQTIDTSRF